MCRFLANHFRPRGGGVTRHKSEPLAFAALLIGNLALAGGPFLVRHRMERAYPRFPSPRALRKGGGLDPPREGERALALPRSDRDLPELPLAPVDEAHPVGAVRAGGDVDPVRRGRVKLWDPHRCTGIAGGHCARKLRSRQSREQAIAVGSSNAEQDRTHPRATRTSTSRPTVGHQNE